MPVKDLVGSAGLLCALTLCVLSLCVLNPGALAQEPPEYAPRGAAQCLGCHDFGLESPVHAVLAGSHGLDGDAADMAGRRGCEDCHGPSAAHAAAPIRVAPAVSFGPRWSATAGAQDERCLSCHEDNIARHWKDALHMVNNVTCVTCHDIHAAQDRVLFEDRQAEVCTVCHKDQKQGIHGLQERASRNPPCSSCHNPHDHEGAAARMLENRSEGCSYCHDLVRMATRASVSAKAKSYHRVMAQPDRTCLDCHQGIAHAASTGPVGGVPEPVASKVVTLFYPGMTDSEWLLHAHPGSQLLRQGSNCQLCHRGDEAAMGAALAGELQGASRDMRLSFAREGEQLSLTLQWRGPADDAVVSVMWGDQRSDAVRRGGCFAACHSDLPGMTRDRGQQLGKYLGISRVQEQRVGLPPIVKGERALEKLREDGEFATLWRVPLDGAGVDAATVLADTQWRPAKQIALDKRYSQGQWTVELRWEMGYTGVALQFSPLQRYTFGVALNGADNRGGKHWVSLPMTLGFGDEDADFTAE